MHVPSKSKPNKNMSPSSRLSSFLAKIKLSHCYKKETWSLIFKKEHFIY